MDAVGPVPLSSPPPTGPPESNIDKRLRFDQYQLAVEMADRLSAKRLAANNFFIGLLSAFSAFDAWLDKVPSSDALSPRALIVAFLPVCVCIVWGMTIASHRRINKVKWDVIYDLEKGRPDHPLRRRKQGSRSMRLL